MRRFEKATLRGEAYSRFASEDIATFQSAATALDLEATGTIVGRAAMLDMSRPSPHLAACSEGVGPTSTGSPVSNPGSGMPPSLSDVLMKPASSTIASESRIWTQGEEVRGGGQEKWRNEKEEK